MAEDQKKTPEGVTVIKQAAPMPAPMPGKTAMPGKPTMPAPIAPPIASPAVQDLTPKMAPSIQQEQQAELSPTLAGQAMPAGSGPTIAETAYPAGERPPISQSIGSLPMGVLGQQHPMLQRQRQQPILPQPALHPLKPGATALQRNRPAAPSYGEGCGCGRMAG